MDRPRPGEPFGPVLGPTRRIGVARSSQRHSRIGNEAARLGCPCRLNMPPQRRRLLLLAPLALSLTWNLLLMPRLKGFGEDATASKVYEVQDKSKTEVFETLATRGRGGGASPPQGSLSREGRQRIVLFVGPHKTGTTSVQKNLYGWIKGNTPSFRDWSYPIPPSMAEELKHPYQGAMANFGKTFFRTPEVRNCNLATPANNITKPREISCREVRTLFMQEFEHQWRDKHKNLLIASEAFDSIGKGNSTTDSLLRTLPWDSSNDSGSGSSHNKLSMEDITVVVNYRAGPRSSHLVSHWHECCMPRVSFRDYLLSSDLMLGLKTVDSLYLAKLLLDAGLRVVLVDLAGAAQDGRDITNVIACEVMEVPCGDSNRTVVGVPPPGRTRVKAGMGDMGNVTTLQLNAIDNVLRRRDCVFRNLREHERLQVLYGDAFLLSTWSEWCTSTAAAAVAAPEHESSTSTRHNGDNSRVPILHREFMQTAIREIMVEGGKI